jgi:CRISPR/Cas system-associated endonuclease Cas1
MSSSTLAIRKNKVLAHIAMSEDEVFIAQIEKMLLHSMDERLVKVNQGIRKGVTIEQMKIEQNYKATCYAEVQALARAVDVQESIEELIAAI